MSLIDDFLNAVGEAFENAGEIVPWPLHVAQLGPFYSDIEALDLIACYHEARAAGLSDSALARLYPSASSAKSLMLDLVPGMKAAGVPAADRVDFVTAVLTGLAEAETGDVLCRDGGHRLLRPEEAEDYRGAPGWTTREDAAKDAFALSGAAQALVWSMHFYGWTDISFVIHGPYPVASDQVLIVRDFFDLSPAPLWPHLPEPPCRSLRVLSLHDATDRFRIDIFNHLLHERPLLASTRAVRVVADGTDLAASGEPRALRDTLVALVRQQKKAIGALSEREVLAKFVESRYYAFRDWRTRTGIPWQPPADVRARLAELPIPPAPGAGEESWHVLKDVFDPRIDFPVN
ncbi:hypothetical protein [Streptomyces sp. BK205]|uniref:hypothetical protein n=1 Tax=Streptomyces sp. BK205 TaxID=2512164 RepID=UPI00104F1E06|nr:hypothetical protein [Streptomyces sp. BK205]TCR16034.1 hypothetical protein EV578_115146 [Streptomyces sp. BK205]